jgi:antitoxin component of MazEF toxin-antitoxin module
MTFAKEQLMREIETLPDTKVEQVAVFVNALKTDADENDALTVEAMRAQMAEEDRQIMERAAQYDPRVRLSLEELLADFKPEHRHPETDWGPPVGKEVW